MLTQTLYLLLLLLPAYFCAAPTQVHVAFTGKPNDVSVMWIGSNANLKYHVQYGFASQKYEKSASGLYKPYVSLATYKPHVYEAILPKLPSNSRIFYRVGNAREGFSQEYTFWTQAENNATSIYPYRFLSYGDMDLTSSSYQTQAYVLKQVQKDALLRFVIHQGDIPYAWTEDRWDTWFNLMQPVTANIAYMVCPGNHESNYDFASYKNRFSKAVGINSKSDSNLYYSWNYGSIHFVALSSEHPYTAGSEQYKWFEKDLQSVNRTNYPFIIFYAHRPMYSSNQNHGSEIQFRKSIEPLLDKYNVNIALFGHVHAYERTCVLKDGSVCVPEAISKDLKTVNTKQGTVHIIAGTAGFELNPNWDAKPYWSVVRETNHGSLRITVQSATSIQIEFVRHRDESVADSFIVNA